MYRKLVGVFYVMNIVFQSFITLASPIALCFFISWLLERYAGAERWIYAPFLIVGVLSGFYSMVKFVIVAMSGYERLESEQAGKGRGSKNGKSGDA
ncbi:MAG: AtpZ/AtpI family protein [Clostridia bacterium]|nr:AtpZ/AtpI family protein [Clostridia bacterium]